MAESINYMNFESRFQNLFIKVGMTVIGVKTVKLKFDIFFLLGKKHNSVTAT
jgi:hypothetical protein